jgi:hypothetical protein
VKKIFIILSLILLPSILFAEEKEAKNIPLNTQIEGGAVVSVTLSNLVYVDMFSKDYHNQHPLVCGEGKDFPQGREMIFKNPESGATIHAVFPNGETAPVKLKGSFVLLGYFQGIQYKDSYKLKKTRSDYRYFVVSSWENEK